MIAGANARAKGLKFLRGVLVQVHGSLSMIEGIEWHQKSTIGIALKLEGGYKAKI